MQVGLKMFGKFQMRNRVKRIFLIVKQRAFVREIVSYFGMVHVQKMYGIFLRIFTKLIPLLDDEPRKRKFCNAT